MDLILRAVLLLVGAVMAAYTVRHALLTAQRLFGRQRYGHQDVLDARMPGVSVLIPMHDEELVATGVLDCLVRADYPIDRLEIIPINDHSTDGTGAILDRYAAVHAQVHPIHRYAGQRGKPAALNDALQRARHEIVLVFDADYLPAAGMVRSLATAFLDPEVGAVMGRVVPRNVGTGLLPRLLDLERSAGYQVDQQARFNLGLVPQYGGTVGGFRRSIVQSWGGFDPRVLAEDTDLTFRMYLCGWKVAYVNRAECYEEVPETWDVRYRQLRRWARGHTQVLLRDAGHVVASTHLSRWQRADALLVLGVYLVGPLLMLGMAANALLFLVGTPDPAVTVGLGLMMAGLGAAGNFAPVFQVSGAGLIDGIGHRLLLLPWLLFAFLFNSWVILRGTADALVDVATNRFPTWDKTRRFAS